jgi:hypothetical protein
MMMTANLVGFVVGIDGLEFLASRLSGTWDGARFMVLATTCVFMGVQLMFEYRYVISLLRTYPVSIEILGRKSCGKAFKGGVDEWGHCFVYNVVTQKCLAIFAS